MKKFLLLCLLMASITVAKAEKWKFYFPVDYQENAELSIFKNGSILVTKYYGYDGTLLRDGTWQRIPNFYPVKDKILPDTVNNVIWVIADSNQRLLKYDLDLNRYVDSLYFQDSLLHFSTLSVDKSGRIWFFSPNRYGLGYIKNKQVVKAEFMTPALDSVLDYFIIGPDDKKYIITRSTTSPSNAKMIVIDGNKVTERAPLSMLASSWIFDTKGNVYASLGVSKKIVRFDGDKIDTITLEHSASYGRIIIDDLGRYFYKGKKDTLYVMSDTGTALFHGKNNPLVKENFNIARDSRGKVWIASSVGLGEWDKPIEEKYRKEYAGLGNDYCLTFVETGEQQYLVSCFDRMTTINAEDKYYTFFNANRDLQFDQILKDNRGQVWYLDQDEYLYKQSKTSYIPVEYNGLPITAYRICIGRDGNLLILRKNDILRYDGVRFQQIVAPFSMNKIVSGQYFLKEDSQNRIWVYCRTCGLFRFDGKGWTEYSSNSLGENAKLFYGAMDLDSNDHLWVSSNGDLRKWDGETWYTYPYPEDSMFHANVEEMAFDKKGKLWITSYLYGVGYFDGIKMVKYTSYNSPLFSNIGLHVKVASNNDKWFFLGFGIMVYNEQDDPIPPTTPMSETISFYPNPTSESITIQNLLADDRIQLFDLTGRKLIDYSPGKEGDELMNLTSLNRGLYLMNIYRKNQAYFQAKVLKE